MNIYITIEDDDGKTLFESETKSVDSAIQDLGRFERATPDYDAQTKEDSLTEN